MAHKRAEFTENQKAKIFVRDKATCAFSCVSLWLLDYGIRPNIQIDWVDHLRPSASGGKADLENGVCVSHTFNAKKRNNTSDNICFVKNGEIKEAYIWMFGEPNKVLLEQLTRLSQLEPSDWFFNKCIDNVFEGLAWRCEVEFKDIRYKRNDQYWFASGWKRLQKYHKKKSNDSIQARGLIKEPMSFGSEKLLSLQWVETESAYQQWIESLYPAYREGYKLLVEMFQEGVNMKGVLAQAESSGLVHPELLKSAVYIAKQKESNV